MTETTTSKIKLADLTNEIRDIERHLAPGSETAMWGDYCEAMRNATGHLPYDDDIDGAMVPADEAQWWRDAYAALQADPDRDAQDIYDSLQ